MIQDAAKLVFSAGAVVFDAQCKRILTIVNKNDRRGYETTSFPKGQLDKNESPESAARREVQEETGAKCTLWPGLIALETRYNEAIAKTKIIYWYAATIDEMGEQKLEDYEKLVPQWTDVSEAYNTLSFENDQDLLKLCLVAAEKRNAA
ncbi:hypothetical protein GGI07_004822 [Coemansia sp. Benny D115]|nr:hypothetical protein GGI07_004822 [Coemansia sp. Benny D115]